MAYLEPGAYSKTQSSRPNTGAGSPSLIPLVIGTGATIMVTSEVITRSAEESDALPMKAKAIKSIGYTSSKEDFVASTDYELSEDGLKITWKTDGEAPKLGEEYIVKFSYEVGDDQYTPKLISELSELKQYFGGDLKTEEADAINNLFVAAQIMLELGSPSIYVLQVKTKTSGTVTGEDYQQALDEHAAFLEDVWRIIPADLSDSINSVIDGHIRKCSSYEERKERCAGYAKSGSQDFRTPDEVLKGIGGYADSKKNARIFTPYPTKATKEFSDGVTRVLTGQFVSAAVAGMEAVMPKWQSKTRASFGCFSELLGVQLTRVNKNKLAEKGVLIIEQPNGPGTDCIIRHQLSTDMSSAENREISILACKDYASKTIRNVCETYIGPYNITADTISRIRGSVSSKLADLQSEGYILEGELISLEQDVNNPDCLLISLRIKVPYPCNYIKITIVVD